MPSTSASPTGSGAACRKPSVNCCSSGRSAGRAASAAAPSSATMQGGTPCGEAEPSDPAATMQGGTTCGEAEPSDPAATMQGGTPCGEAEAAAYSTDPSCLYRSILSQSMPASSMISSVC